MPDRASACRHFMIACALALASSFALAEGFSLRPGLFGTLGVNWHANDDLSYRRSAAQYGGARGGTLDASVDSLLGVQLNARFTDALDAVGQVVARQQPNGGWHPQTTLAFVRVEPAPGLQLRFGRLGLDSVPGADSRLVGYALPTIRPVPEVFAALSVDFIDGADITYRFDRGDNLFQLKAYTGEHDSRTYIDGAPFDLYDIRSTGVTASWFRDGWEARVGAGTGKFLDNGDSQLLVDLLASLPLPSSVAAARALDSTGARSHFHHLELHYDEGPWDLLAGYVRLINPRRTPHLPRQRMFHAQAAYRMGRFTPYLTWARIRTEAARLDTGLAGSPPFALLDSFAQAWLQAAQFNQRTLSAGVRFDLRPGIALKAQVDRIVAGRSVILLDERNFDSTARRTTLFSLALDFAF
ncbi:MAG: hypothetical protein KDH20_07135 [Rhodocyclaceae bacterium]|nr:hypothetical protein [Rhodocyclaceae bacterium]